MNKWDKHKNANAPWLELGLNTFFRQRAQSQTHSVDRKSFHPSQAGQCARALWYQLSGYSPKATTVTSQRYFVVGSAFHVLVQDALKQSGFVSVSEVYAQLSPDTLFPPQWGLKVSIEGTCDVIMERPYDKEPFLVEIKTHKDSLKDSIDLDFSEDSTIGPWDDLTHPHSAHIYQWQLYSLLMGVNEGCIFYINRNDLRFKVFEQKRDDDVILDLMHKFEDIKTYVDEGILYPFQKDEKHNWCAFAEQCQLDYWRQTGDDGKDIFKRSLPKGSR